MGRDLRRYSRQTNFRLVLGGILILYLIGDGLVYWIYGPAAALMGLVCLSGGLAPLLLILLVLYLMEWVVKRANQD
jgi:hypothetical protein